MGFPSFDALLAAGTGGQSKNIRYQKTSSNGATSAAGRWHEFFTATGIPAAGAFSGSAGVATALTRSSTGAMDVNANVSPDTRHLLYGSIYTAASTITPAVAILVDLLLYYPSCVVTGFPTSLDNTVTLPRYTTGEGVFPIIAVQTALGAATPSLTLTYTDQGGTGGNAADAMVSPANSAPVSTLFQSSGGSPFLPLASGDYGVRKVDSYSLSSGTTGTASIILAKSLLEIPISAQYSMAEREYLSQIAPQIEDGACLAWLLQIGGAMTTAQTILGSLNYAWD